ncbi:MULTISPECIES: 50S ribosomal protein L25 [unclassified Treponema]|uniref:50S ribosomal protein L25 n=1 Tax=unclassified Treponema TaxID=2638727 RepID=UPI0020A4630E|nr:MULTISPECIES: 50S ribosomal protein L25 [unclassified Treponema]UTC67793.1 50S ribosomal protein L25 [Treponema sp. OMZ 789]UTC70518.1 50S ribosomal protein L25 [Treponema sp. OMZ 790]UTC73230.1 50S ribosomal protein L25 [Treponema sp. OMZ 791]
MEQRLLNANERSTYGKSAAVKMRKSGRIPAVMYDRHGKSVSLDVDEREFMKLFKVVTESTIVTLSASGKDYEVFIKDFQHDIVNDRIMHVDFYEVERGKALRTKVKIRLEGSPEGVRHGGILETGITELELECLPKDLPPRIIVDVSALDVNQSLHVRDIKLPEAVTVLTSDDITVAAVKFAAAETTAPAAEAEGEGQEAAPAASEEAK